MPIVKFKKHIPLDNGLNDFLITELVFDTESKKVVSFVVLQVYHFSEEVHGIIRFDTAHGVFHVHRFYKKLDHREDMPNNDISGKTFNVCRIDVKDNWKKYRSIFFKKWLS